MYDDLIMNCISHIFMLMFIYTCIESRYGRLRTTFLFVMTYMILCTMEFVVVIYDNLFGAMIVVKVFQSLVTQAQPFIIAKRRNVSLLLVGINAVICVSIANTTANLLFYFTKNLILEIVVYIIMQVIIIMMIKRFLIEKDEVYIPKGIFNWIFLLIIPAAGYLIAFLLLSVIKQSVGIIGIVLALAIFIVLIILVYYIIFSFLKAQRETMELGFEKKSYLNMIESMNRNISILRESERKTAVIRHDIRHYMVMVNQLIIEENYDEAKEVLERYIEAASNIASKRCCENITVNALLVRMRDRALSQNIQVDINTVIPEKLPCSSVELAVIISNLFENAIEACMRVVDKKDRHISILAKKIEKKLIIEIQNSYEVMPKVDQKKQHLISEKEGNHGVGLVSARMFAEQNNAIFDYTFRENVFYVRLLLML